MRDEDMLDGKWMLFVYTVESKEQSLVDDLLMLIRYNGSRLFDTEDAVEAEAKAMLHGLKARGQKTGWRAGYVNIWTREHPVPDCRVKLMHIEDQ